MQDIETYIQKSKEERTFHIDLSSLCIERGGISTYSKALMAHVLDTTIPSGHKILVCHACNNPKCSSPKHLYFGTPKENVRDSIDAGTFKSAWQNRIDKYGYDLTMKMLKEQHNKGDGAGRDEDL